MSSPSSPGKSGEISHDLPSREGDEGGEGQTGKLFEIDEIAKSRRFSVRSKFLLIVLITMLIALGASTYFASHYGKTALTDSSFRQLTSYRTAKVHEVERSFKKTRRALSLLGSSPGVIAAFRDLNAGYEVIPDEPVSAEANEKLHNYYLNDFLPAMSGDSSEHHLEDFWPVNHRALRLQELYISKNPFPFGKRRLHVKSAIDIPYTRAHAKHHEHLRRILRKNRYYDLFLIEPSGGAVIYSVEKQIDFGTSLTDGPFARTELGTLSRSVVRKQERELVNLKDYSFYAPSRGLPAAFMATPIFDGFRFLGVLAVQLSSAQIDELLTSSQQWESQGLGKTGGAYIAGQDRLMRTNSREILEEPEQFLEEVKGLSYLPEGSVARMNFSRSTILNFPVPAEPIAAAALGESGTRTLPIHRNRKLLASFAPLDIPDVEWTLLATIHEAEILASQREFNRSVLMIACSLALLATLTSLWMSRTFLRPVNLLLTGIDQLRGGQKEVSIPQTSRDEFGEVVSAFNAMSVEMTRREELIEKKNDAYSGLLRRIFPETIADRMRAGGLASPEKFQNVTVIYVMIDGLLALSENDAVSVNRVLTDLVDSFDDAADLHGVEKVKTIGDHYLAVCGLNASRLDHARGAIDWVFAMQREVEAHNRANNMDLKLRIGLASGEIHAGMVGNRRFVYDVWGLAATIARRIVWATTPGSVRVNELAYQALHSHCGERRAIRLKTKTLGILPTYQYDLTQVVKIEGVTASESTTNVSPA